MKKSALQKLHSYPNLPVVKPIPPALLKRLGHGTIAIPSPLQLLRYIQAIPPGRIATIRALAQGVADELQASTGCAVTTAIFANQISHAAPEAELTHNAAYAAPYWRVLKNDGELNPKYPGGIANLSARLEAEGHEVVQRRNRYFVAVFEARLFDRF